MDIPTRVIEKEYKEIIKQDLLELKKHFKKNMLNIINLKNEIIYDGKNAVAYEKDFFSGLDIEIRKPNESNNCLINIKKHILYYSYKYSETAVFQAHIVEESLLLTNKIKKSFKQSKEFYEKCNCKSYKLKNFFAEYFWQLFHNDNQSYTKTKELLYPGF